MSGSGNTILGAALSARYLNKLDLTEAHSLIELGSDKQKACQQKINLEQLNIVIT